jgi:hypothetical protein
MTAVVIVICVATIVFLVFLGIRRSAPDAAIKEPSRPDLVSPLSSPAGDEIVQGDLISVAGEKLTAEELQRKIRCIWNDKGVLKRNLDHVRSKTTNGDQFADIEIMAIAYEEWIIKTRGWAAGPSVRPPASPGQPPLVAGSSELPPHRSENADRDDPDTR